MYDEDTLDIGLDPFSDIEEESISKQLVEPGINSLTGRPTTVEAKPVTPQPITSKDVLINGRYISNWSLLKTSNNVSVIMDRIENDVQKFMTKEGEIIYIAKHILKRIDFTKLMTAKWKKRDFTVNLPDRFQVKLRVGSDGNVSWRQHKRKPGRKNKRVNKSSQLATRKNSQTKQSKVSYSESDEIEIASSLIGANNVKTTTNVIANPINDFEEPIIIIDDSAEETSDPVETIDLTSNSPEYFLKNTETLENDVQYNNFTLDTANDIINIVSSCFDNDNSTNQEEKQQTRDDTLCKSDGWQDLHTDDDEFDDADYTITSDLKKLIIAQAHIPYEIIHKLFSTRRIKPVLKKIFQKI